MPIPQRIVIVGVSGSGKTTFAQQLAQRLTLPHVELDSLYWEANWVGTQPDVFRKRVTDALAGDRWVVDGNYSSVRDLIWPIADTLIWLDYPLPVTLWRLTRRTWRRIVRQEVLWNNNRDRWKHQLGRESLFLWALKSYRKQQRTYPILFQSPAYAHLTVMRLSSPKAAQDWIDQL